MGKMINLIAQKTDTFADRMAIASIESIKVSKQGEQGRDTSMTVPSGVTFPIV